MEYKPSGTESQSPGSLKLREMDLWSSLFENWEITTCLEAQIFKVKDCELGPHGDVAQLPECSPVVNEAMSVILRITLTRCGGAHL